DEIGRSRRRIAFRDADKFLVKAGQPAGRVGRRRIAEYGEGLASAAAPVDLATIAGAAGLGHPAGAAETVERLGVQPDVPKAALTCRIELQRGVGLGGVTVQTLSRR